MVEPRPIAWPTVPRGAAAPRIPSTPGIEIVVADPGDAHRPIVRGAFRIEDDAPEACARTPHRAIVLVATARGFHAACAPFREAALFGDDVVVAAGCLTGTFSIDAAAALSLEPGVAYHLHCALATYASAIVTLVDRA